MNNSVKSPFEILAGYERRSLAHAGTGSAGQASASDLWRGVGFRIGDHYLVSSLTEINEVLSFPVVTRVPGARAWLLGVASVRGNLIPLVDLKGLLAGEETSLSDSSRVLLVRQSGGSVGLLVDEVVGQRNFSADQRVGAPASAGGAVERYVVEHYALGDTQWGRFSMAALVRANEFAQAAV
ncbi:MAG: purine-binding chemotaxis protein CheW [Proteobacteria bacterium]|uniref:chemotaxis protein CheW n=1 Tax=Rudaea sp. TaxID=2136325 RepID=UPI001D897657|nr:purine-binding chemotaxis protein CheW [Pseudomonadota bacterium]MBS0566960.1 purine-binding chemotaxis protein CheW [Pseudomonadota bacterium]